MHGQPGHIKRADARLQPSYLDMEAWMTSQLNIALISKLRGSLMCLAFFLHVIQGCLYNQAMADVQLKVQDLNVCTVAG